VWEVSAVGGGVADCEGATAACDGIVLCRDIVAWEGAAGCGGITGCACGRGDAGSIVVRTRSSSATFPWTYVWRVSWRGHPRSPCGA